MFYDVFFVFVLFLFLFLFLTFFFVFVIVFAFVFVFFMDEPEFFTNYLARLVLGTRPVMFGQKMHGIGDKDD